MTYLCAPIFVVDPAQALRDAALAAEAGAELIEYRVDGHPGPTHRQIIERSPLPCIVTCRPTWEGGRSALPDDLRLYTLHQAVEAGASYVDIELATYRTVGRQLRPDVRSILSVHDFGGRPEGLYNLLMEMNAAPSVVNKVVWSARTIRDNQEAFELLVSRQKPTIALCMGEHGLLSRILAKKFGAFLTFAALDPESATAPGQVTIADLKGLYRWDAIGPDTRVYGVVGSPIAHSMSPAIHNAAFERAGFDGVYVPLLVNPGYESFKAFMEVFVRGDGPLRFSGLSVTIPHKENALRYLRSLGTQATIEPLAEAIGAVNTIDIRVEGASIALRGINTDYAAILDSITAELGIAREGLKSMPVAVLGAGGTGRTAVAALAHYGAAVTVYNRTVERASVLAGEFNGRTGPVRAAPLDEAGRIPARIVINTTSIGMHPHSEASPLPEDAFGRECLYVDMVYNPPQTQFIARALAAGAQTVGGVDMFLRQAVGQFELWTGLKAPSDIMRRVINSRLPAPPR